MDIQSFQAQRREDLLASDERLGPIVEAALLNRDEPNWFTPIVDQAEQIWIEFHQAEAPGANFGPALQRFRGALAEALSRTSANTNTGRVTRWTTAFTVNDGTVTGAYARGIRYKMWRTMRDDDVREIHQAVNGQLRPIGGLFDLGGARLPYPGAPVGPGQYWIECRCVAQPASREGEEMSTTTFALDPDATPEPQEPTTYTGLVLVLTPAESDSIVAASSEPAHITVAFMGEAADQSEDALAQIEEEARAYAATLDGPVVAPVAERGILGDDDADVVFLEPTESLIALRDGLIEASPAIKAAMDSVEQFPDWQPHVTLGYPETPARAEYDGTEVTFDRVGLWVAGEQKEFPMSKASLAAAAVEADDTELPVDELEDGEEEITEIPVHGVATIEGKATGDGREFARGALSHRNLPLPLRLETVGTHGGDTSHAVPVGRIDEMWREESDEYNEYRYRGVIITTKQHASQAIEGIVDGSLTGVSVETDMTVRDPAHGEAQDAVMKRMMDGEELSSEDAALLNKDVCSESRVCGFTIVPIPAFQEAFIGLGMEFADEMSDEALVACAACGKGEPVWDDENLGIDLTSLSPEELETYDALPPLEQEAWANDNEMIFVASSYREISPEQRRKLADEGKALPDGSFPIENEEDLKNAIQSIGRASDPEKARAFIKKRARELDREDLIPEDWALVAAAFAPGTKDGPGWITHPVPTSRIRRYWVRGEGAAKIRWGQPGDFNRCRRQLAKYIANPEWLAGACANMHKEALGVWPGREGNSSLVASGATAAPLFSLTAAAVREYPTEWFQRQDLDNPAVGVIVDGDRVYGYVSAWGVCHIGIEGVCTTAPPSTTDYAYFATGYIHTEDGEKVRVGQITIDTGHANLRSNAKVAAAHYDNTGAAAADVAIGEDAFGIWFAGALRSSISDEQRHALEASGRVSGDWRQMMGGGLELIAALAVNVPGFPIPVQAGFAASAEGQLSLVAAGVVVPEVVETHESSGDENVDYVANIVENVLDRISTREHAQEARARLDNLRLADARRRLAERV